MAGDPEGAQIIRAMGFDTFFHHTIKTGQGSIGQVVPKGLQTIHRSSTGLIPGEPGSEVVDRITTKRGLTGY